MDKIFEKETVKYIEGFGISKGEIAKIQKQKLKESAISILRQVADAINKEDFFLVKRITFSSGSGDGYGQDNTCIDFGGIAGDLYDIERLFHEIGELNNIIKKECKGE